MGIETTLTLALAGAILVSALVLLGLVVGGFRLVRGLWRTIGGSAGIRGRHDHIEDALPRLTLWQRLAAAGHGVATAVAFVAAHTWAALTAVGRALSSVAQDARISR